MEDTHLLAVRQDGVLTLTLNRPERRNALSPQLYENLREQLSLAAADDAIGAVVLTGAGGAFCAGGDVARMADASAAETLSFEARANRLRRRAEICELLHEMPKLTLAMIRGAAVGAGLSIALACDMRIGDDTARLKTGFIDVGVPGDFGGHYFLPRIVGAARARELYLCSPLLDAGQAAALGLLNQKVAAEQLEAVVMAIARHCASHSRTAVGYMKRNLNDALGATLGEVLDAEAWRHVRCTETPEHRDAVRARAARRRTATGAEGGGATPA